MKKLVTILLLFIFVGVAAPMGCKNWKDIGPTIKKVTDIAGDLCRVIAAQEFDIDPAKLGGMTVEQWCAIEENAANVLNVIFAAKVQAEENFGFTSTEEDLNMAAGAEVCECEPPDQVSGGEK